MKKYLPIFIAFQILATSLPNNQGMQTMFKMGAFFHHFVHHVTCQQENIGLVDFVKLHYFNKAHQASDPDGHKNLPFQQDHRNQQNPAPQTPFLLTEPYSVLAFVKLEIVSNPLISRPKQWFFALYLGDIWQPPKA